MQPRQEGEKLRGKLEFPGGKIEAEETPELAASRECLEECQIEISPDSFKLFNIYDVNGEYSAVRLYVMLAEFDQGSEVGEWYQLKTDNPLFDIQDKIMPANHPIIKDVVGYLSGLSSLNM